MKNPESFRITSLGAGIIPSPLVESSFIRDECVPFSDEQEEIKECLATGRELPAFEAAGPRETLLFDPLNLKCGIVTCGGLCPGLNDVIRAIVRCAVFQYRVKSVLGFQFGYEGLISTSGHSLVELTPDSVDRIQEKGGTILGSSRGNQDVRAMVDTLQNLDIGILFAIGGDGTLRGAHAIVQEIQARGLKIAVIGVPKTIDNDISCIQSSFGFETAVSEARRATRAAHVEATGYRNGIVIVKLMGRDSGFIAGYATLADSHVNFCLIPELAFTLEGFLRALRDRIERRGHAVVVIAEGAGQDLVTNQGERDASGNVRYSDIALFLKDRTREYFQAAGVEINLKYIDPSYMIRSLPANSRDAAFCLLLGQNAVHAGMAGKTDMVVGNWMNKFTHVPIPLAIASRKKVDIRGFLWNSVLASTGQPRNMQGRL